MKNIKRKTKRSIRDYQTLAFTLLTVAFFAFFAIRPSLTLIVELFHEQTLYTQVDKQLEEKIQQIIALQSQANNQQNKNLCYLLQNNLHVGLFHNSDVSCLQQFLKNQGPEIYSEGLITGNFGMLTKSAVINFQKKYNIAQTGFVGVLTRAKINQLLNDISNVR